MGRSLRRAKRYRTKVRVDGEKKHKNVKAPAPLELTLEAGAAALAVKLPKLVSVSSAAAAGGEDGPPTTSWNPARPLTKNYAAVGVAADANARYGRNRRPSVLDVKANDEGEEEGNGSDGDGGGNSTDDDLRAVSGLPRKHSARAPPPKLTSTQERVISALREAHGPNNVEAMVKDIKLNRMLLPASKLKKMIEADDFWGKRPGKPSLDQVGVEGKGRGRCGFRMPRKSL